MKFDFSVPMTFYEFLAIVLSAIAIIIPIVQAVWKKWMVQAKLHFLPTGRASLFFSHTGSFIRIDGVCEAENKPIAIKKMTVTVTRRKDDRKLNLSWFGFISPVNQSMFGNYLQTTEAAHPFRIEADSIACSFIEFGDPFDSFGRQFKAFSDPLCSQISSIQIFTTDYNEAVTQYKALSEYFEAKRILENEFFWDIGNYDIEIQATYGNKTARFPFSISVGEYEYSSLIRNVEEVLLLPLKRAYGIQTNYQTAFVELKSE